MARKNEDKGAAAPQELVLSGDLTVRRISALKGELEQVLASGGAVQLRLAEVAEVDLAFLQLLCAAHRQASRQEQVLTVSGDAAGRFVEALLQGGFGRQIGCAADSRHGCLWPVAEAEK